MLELDWLIYYYLRFFFSNTKCNGYLFECEGNVIYIPMAYVKHDIKYDGVGGRKGSVYLTTAKY